MPQRGRTADPAPDALLLTDLIALGALDAELAALAWLLAGGGVPIVVAGPRADSTRLEVARAVLEMPPARPWLCLDAEQGSPDTAVLASALGQGVTPAVVARASSLRELLSQMSSPPRGVAEDALRHLGLVLILEPRPGPMRARVQAAHYLRPTERDGQGHLQRRPPAVLATWDEPSGTFEHFAWGITPELADRVDRSQADFERRQAGRARVLADLAAAALPATVVAARLRDHVATEPPREPAPWHPAARSQGMTGTPPDPHVH